MSLMLRLIAAFIYSFKASCRFWAHKPNKGCTPFCTSLVAPLTFLFLMNDATEWKRSEEEIAALGRNLSWLLGMSVEKLFCELSFTTRVTVLKICIVQRYTWLLVADSGLSFWWQENLLPCYQRIRTSSSKSTLIRILSYFYTQLPHVKMKSSVVCLFLVVHYSKGCMAYFSTRTWWAPITAPYQHKTPSQSTSSSTLEDREPLTIQYFLDCRSDVLIFDLLLYVSRDEEEGLSTWAEYWRHETEQVLASCHWNDLSHDSECHGLSSWKRMWHAWPAIQTECDFKLHLWEFMRRFRPRPRFFERNLLITQKPNRVLASYQA